MTTNPVDAGPVDAGAVESWLRTRLGELLGLAPDAIPAGASFESLGVDSAQAVNLMMDVEAWLDLPDELPLGLLFDDPAIDKASAAIAAEANRMLAQAGSAQ